jgi:hypothetical protein
VKSAKRVKREIELLKSQKLTERNNVLLQIINDRIDALEWVLKNE